MAGTPGLWKWVGAGGVLSLAGVVFDAARATPSRNLSDEIRRQMSAAQSIGSRPDSASNAVVQAAVLLQLSDCSGNLRMLHVLHRGTARREIHLATIWYVGAISDSAQIRAALPAWTKATPLRPAPTAVLRQFASLGHTSTPTLLVLDQEGRVRLTTQSPRSAREVAGLRRIVEGLTWIEEN